MPPDEAWTHSLGVYLASYGWPVDGVGDVDGDGYGDIVAGASNTQSAILHGGAAVGVQAEVWSGGFLTDGDGLILYAGSAGDLNADGFGDVVVADPTFDVSPDEQRSGAARIYLGSSGGLAGQPSFELRLPENAGRGFGFFSGDAGDVNGDGFDDLLIGSALAYQGGPATLFLGCDAGLGLDPVWRRESAEVHRAYSGRVGNASDFNADGYADLAIVAPRDDGLNEIEIFLGSSGVLSEDPDAVLVAPALDILFGTGLATGGDLDGDGFDDLVVGSPWLGDGAGRRVDWYRGCPDGLADPACAPRGGEEGPLSEEVCERDSWGDDDSAEPDDDDSAADDDDSGGDSADDEFLDPETRARCDCTAPGAASGLIPFGLIALRRRSASIRSALSGRPDGQLGRRRRLPRVP